MADDTQGKPSIRATGVSLMRSVVLYLIVGAAAAGISGWYLFGYVPAKLQYFLGMRFRTLAVASGQFKSKTEALSAAVQTAKGAQDPAVYLRALVPALKTTLQDGYQVGDCPKDPKDRTDLCYRIDWDDLLEQASASTRSNFDDLMLADRDGKVLWQRERTTPRVGNLPQLLERTSGTRSQILNTD